MNFIGDLGQRLTERWLATETLLGLLYLVLTWLGTRLGYAHAVDARQGFETLASTTEQVTGWRAPLAITAGLLLLGAAALVAWCAKGLAVAAEQLVLTHRKPAPPAAPTGDVEPDRTAGWGPAAALRRLAAPLTRMEAEFRQGWRIDPVSVWPCLWSTLNPEARADVVTARTRIRSAAALVGWAVLYALLALWWPLAWVPAAVLAGMGLIRWRTAMLEYARTITATLRMNMLPLATSMGIEHTGRFTARTGWMLTLHLQFGDAIIDAPPPRSND